MRDESLKEFRLNMFHDIVSTYVAMSTIYGIHVTTI